MARWDEILTLPVQNPPTLEFSSADIVWSRVEGWRETIDKVALIPFSRVNDFVRGESNSKECPTRFHVEARRRRPPEMPYKPKVDGILEYILYWCSFGPDDHRKGGIIRPSRNYSAKRKTPAGRPNTKRGCVCHFIVKRLIAEPSVALIIYNHEKHVDKQGLPCHGPQDKKAVGTRAMFAPYISEELRLQVMSLLYVGVPVETIMQRHTETVDKQGGPCNRDDLLTHRYVRRLERKIRRSTYELDTDDAVSLSMWIESHQNDIFFYEDFSDSEPFVLGIQTEWQLQQMIRFGNRSLMASDLRFGTNKLKYPVHSLLVFDANNNAIPVAWIITPRFASGDTHRWLRAIYDRVRSKDPNWKLGGFIVDDPSADVVTIREVFQCSVLICFWRVRHAWHKNLMEKCSEREMSVEIFRRLGKAISIICRGGGDADSFEGFLEDFVDCSDFLDYFKAVWFPRLGAWTSALKTLPLATLESSAAIECYHHQLKFRLLNEKDPSVYHRADWLVDKLGTKVHSYYWLDEFAGKADFARYWKDEWKSSLTSWRQALQIPDSDVIVDSKYAKVISQKNQDKVHTVCNPGSEFAICECSWSRVGNLCKHAIKASIVYRERGLVKPSISLFEYNQILTNILHCPPHDSLIRDHTVALAVSVQMQLNALFDPENGRTAPSISVAVDHQTDRSIPATDILENSDVAGVTVSGNVMDGDMQFVQTSPTGLVPIEKVMANGNAFAMDSTENGARDLFNESMGLDTNNSNTLTTRDGSQDGVSEVAVTDKIMDNDPEPIQSSASTFRPEISSDGGMEAYNSVVSDVLATGKELSDVAERCSLDSMNIDSIETRKGGNDCPVNITEKARMDQMMNGVSIDSGVPDVAENGCNQGKAIGAAAVGGNGCGGVDGVGADMEIDRYCNSDEKELIRNTISNAPETDLGPCFSIAEVRAQDSGYVGEEVAVIRKSSCADDVEEGDAKQLPKRSLATDGVAVEAPNEASNNEQLTPIIGQRVGTEC